MHGSMMELQKELLSTFSDPQTSTEAQALELLSRLTKPVYFGSTGKQLLQCACRNGWTAAFRVLIDIHDCDQRLIGRLLLEACESGHLDIVRFLLVERHCSIAYEDHLYSSPLHRACESGNLDLVGYLVSEQHCDPACKDFFGETLLHEVCQNGHLDIFRYLVTEQHCDPACKNDYGATPLHEVCRNGHLDIVRYLVTEQHCDPACKNDYGATPLHEVCRNGHLDIVRYLVTECQCDPLQPLNDGERSPFSLASSSFHHKVVVFLVSTGKVDLRSILMHIRRWSLDESQVLELLSQYPGAEVNVDIDFWRRERTLLDYSCEKGWYKVVRMLVETEYCCDPRLRDENGNTSLHYACKSGHMGIVKYLVTEQHCDPVCKNHDGRTPLHEACERGHLDIAKYLVTDQHCDPACEDHDGRTPLHEACENGHVDTVKFLVSECQCDPQQPLDDCGDSPFSL